jgi:sirohydrochlorin cobaltochelatase
MGLKMSNSALILFAHGARDERWKEPFTRLKSLIEAQDPTRRVILCFLELMSPSLPEAIETLVQDGIQVIEIVPIFFGQGGHIRRDFPKLLDECRAKYPNLELSTKAAVGEDDNVLAAIARYCTN